MVGVILECLGDVRPLGVGFEDEVANVGGAVPTEPSDRVPPEPRVLGGHSAHLGGPVGSQLVEVCIGNRIVQGNARANVLVNIVG